MLPVAAGVFYRRAVLVAAAHYWIIVKYGSQSINTGTIRNCYPGVVAPVYLSVMFHLSYHMPVMSVVPPIEYTGVKGNVRLMHLLKYGWRML